MFLCYHIGSMKSRSGNPLIYLSKHLWKYSENTRKNVVAYVSLFVVADVLDALDPLVIGIFLNAIQTQGVHPENLGYLFLLLGIFVGKEILFWVFHGVARVIENVNALHVRNTYKRYLLQGTMDLPIEWHTDHHSGDTIDKIQRGSDALNRFSESTFLVLQAIIRIVIALIALFYFDALTAGIVIALSIFALWIMVFFDRKLVPGYEMVNNIENTASAKVFDTLSNVTTVIILRIEALVLKSIDVALKKSMHQYAINAKNTEWKWFSASIVGRCIVVVVIGFYMATHLSGGTILVGTIYILYGYANQIRDTFFQFAYLYNDIVRQRASVTNAEEISRLFEKESNKKDRHLPKSWSAITIENLAFSYHQEEGADLHLDVASFEMKKGDRIALIGESGGGKSTFLKVARDLYHPKIATFLVGRKKYAKGFSAISDSISLVPQDPEIFATTIRENITLGIEYSDKYVERFMDMACFSDVVRRLPKGLESSIVEKGVNLSGGEKQRLALARGLLASADKDIVLLDEPTSSVDLSNEMKIYQNIFTAFPDKTILSSIHRFHLLPMFDRIYFFKGGKIIASGSFEELREHSLEFQELWQKYIENAGVDISAL